MPLIAIRDIEISDRQRSEMTQSKIDELKQSIIEHGLFNPITVTPIDGGYFQLVAGGRRLRVFEEFATNQPYPEVYHNGELITRGYIPVTYAFGDALELAEIELDENIMREDLSWPDRVRAIAAIHSLRKIANPEQTYVATAKEINAKSGKEGSPQALSAEISRAMITAEFLDDPEVKAAGNEKLAFNAAARKIRNEFAKKLADKTAGTSKHQFIEGDALKHLETIQSEFRAFILDPPYGIGAHAFGNAAEGRHGYDDSFISAEKLNCDLIDACTRIAAPDAHLWLFCDIELFIRCREALQGNGWQVFRTPIVWNSGTSGHVPSQKIAIRRNYELLLFATRNGRGLSQMLDDVIRINSRSTDSHGAQKPVELYELLLRLSTNAGDRVLDPTCGAGTIFSAATSLGLSATGIELDPGHAETCRGLLAELSLKEK